MKIHALLLLGLFGMGSLAGCMSTKTNEGAQTPSVTTTPTVSLSASSTVDAMCSQPGMAAMCGGGNASMAPKKLATKVLQFPAPSTMSNAPTITLALDSGVKSLSIQVWVNATSPGSPYAIAGPGTPPSDPVLSLKPESGASKVITLTGCNGQTGASAAGPIKSYTDSLGSVASSYTVSVTGNGKNAEVDIQVTETFA